MDVVTCLRKRRLVMKNYVNSLNSEGLLGGIKCTFHNGNHLVLQKYSLKYNVGNVLKKQTTQKVQSHMFHLRHSTMEWMDSLAMKAA